jgi:hypothetical protein
VVRQAHRESFFAVAQTQDLMVRLSNHVRSIVLCQVFDIQKEKAGREALLE